LSEMQDAHRTKTLGTAQATGRDFVHSRAFELLSRGGFVARGLIYAIIGILALKLALHTVAHQPFGKLLLTLVAIGLAGYSLWRFIRAAIGHGPEGSDSGFDRLAAAASGVAYGAMCFIAVKILLGSGSGGSTSPKKAASGIFGWPAGTWIVGIAGAVMVGVALLQVYKGLSQKFLEDSKVEEMGVRMRTWIGRIGTVGHLARGVVFGLVGIFIVPTAACFSASSPPGSLRSRRTRSVTPGTAGSEPS